MVLSTQLKATNDGLIWPKRPLISSTGLISSLHNLKARKSLERGACFKCVAFHPAEPIFCAADEKGYVFVFFVKQNRSDSKQIREILLMIHRLCM